MNKAEATSFIIALARHGNQRRAAAAMGLAQSSISGRYNKARELLGDVIVDQLMRGEPVHEVPVASSRASAPVGTAAGAAPGSRRAAVADAVIDAIASGKSEGMDLHILEDENKRLRSQNKTLAEQILTDEQVRRHIFEIAHSKPSIPEWLSMPAPTAAHESIPGVPILFGSDWHWGEVVKPSEIGGVNEYNLEIARARLHRLVETTIDLLTNHMVNPQYPGIVFALGGDMVSGNIHEELSETNDMPIMPVVLDLVDNLYAAIKRLKEVFGKVFLPCVAGNHGRSTKKIRAKEFNFNSYDWLIYQQLDRLFADDPDVIFYIPDGTDALVSVYGHRYLFSHGNQFRGGDGLIGPLGPIVRGDHKKRGRNGQVGQEYDTLVIGHFHTLMQMKRIIVNGSLIGYNEYAYANNFGYEPPQQALWLTHPVHGITFSLPVNVGEDFGKQARLTGKEPWVAFHEAKKAA
ncbi:helix-turn-helix domain-containing protein [Burkholderia ubonensis]|uniref:helix-turn-helix domain-containing protein n=1 Tax=Burkholderia ubonensis TaxID=101571 RepID=UPI000ABF612B|nr:LysR family transcriptional regulator [Burkholderia ubonensis]